MRTHILVCGMMKHYEEANTLQPSLLKLKQRAFELAVAGYRSELRDVQHALDTVLSLEAFHFRRAQACLAAV